MGIPLSTRKVTIIQFLPLIDKMLLRIKSWMMKFLTNTGKLQLVKYILFSIEIYCSQVFFMAKKVIQVIDSTCSTLFWMGDGGM